jgi:hypothetical protein
MRDWCPKLQGFYPLWNPSLRFPFVYRKHTIPTADVHRAALIPIQVHTPGPEQNLQRDLWRKICLRKGQPRGQVALVSLWMTGEGVDTDDYIQDRMREYEWCNPTYYVHSNSAATTGIYWDIMFNRHKSFFCDRSERLRDLHWTTHHSDAMWTLDPIPETKHSQLKYLAPVRVYSDALRNGNPRMQRRMQLVMLCEQHSALGICSHNRPLEPQDPNPDLMRTVRDRVDSIWMPIHNKFYAKTYFSAYVESVVGSGETRCITEKTYDPLIKGHFVLPFGYSGIVNDILNMGFQMPYWIDYSYDKEPDQNVRWKMWEREFTRLAQMPDDEWSLRYEQDQWMLEMNRERFFKLRYDKLKFPLRKERE